MRKILGAPSAGMGRPSLWGKVLTKGFGPWALGLILAVGALAGAENLKPGEAAIFYRNGDMIIDEVLGLSSARHALELKTVRQISLNNLWMVNFVDTEWFHPKELEKVDTNQHHIFLKNGDLFIGRIVRYNAGRMCFQFESGEEFPIDQIRRMYFTRNIPEKFLREIEKAFPGQGRTFRSIKH